VNCSVRLSRNFTSIASSITHRAGRRNRSTGLLAVCAPEHRTAATRAIVRSFRPSRLRVGQPHGSAVRRVPQNVRPTFRLRVSSHNAGSVRR
jgi:hypothetical protein